MKQIDINELLFYSFRYALGRSTYAVSDVCRLIMKYQDQLTIQTRDLIKKEIRKEENKGMKMFVDQWLILLNFLEDK